MDELRFFQAVEAGGDGVEFVDHVVFLVRREGPAIDPDGPGPGGETVVRASETPGELDDAPPWGVVAPGTGDREAVEYEV